jgi:ABC-type antimicrobial peptide transport system permease subunit
MVKSVGVTSHLPLEARGANPNPLYPEDAPEWSKKLPPLQVFTNIGGGYFEALRIPIIAGRGFEALARQHEMEALISRQTASFFWHDTTGVAALGKRFRALPTDPLYTIVGVVEDTRDSTLAAPPSPTVYLPILVRRDSVERPKSRTMALVVRTTGGAGAAFGAVQRVVHELDPTLPTFDARPMTSVVRASTSRLAFTTLILAAAAVVTVLLGAVGLYGVLAYLVTLRRRELGIRIALGASPPHIAASLTRHGLMLAGVGTLLGLAVLVIAARGIRGFLFGVTAWDPLAVGGSTLLLFAVTIVASWFPARRASRVDPAEALRAD